MSWFSILPPSISFIETWAIRLFVCCLHCPKPIFPDQRQLLLGALAIGPWLLLIVYDAILYIFRAATYDIPYIGGRARNRPRPRAPSLSERPSGRSRTFSLTANAVEVVEGPVDGLKKRLEKSSHERSRRNVTVAE
jgi:hypothetical protein